MIGFKLKGGIEKNTVSIGEKIIFSCLQAVFIEKENPIFNFIILRKTFT